MVTSERANLHALAAEVARLLARPEPDGLLTARQVAERFNVDRSWVYAHADQLGVIRLGNGPRPRLRFDPAVVAQRVLPSPRAVVPTALSRGGAATPVPLLPIKSTRRRRTLDS